MKCNARQRNAMYCTYPKGRCWLVRSGKKGGDLKEYGHYCTKHPERFPNGLVFDPPKIEKNAKRGSHTCEDQKATNKKNFFGQQVTWVPFSLSRSHLLSWYETSQEGPVYCSPRLNVSSLACRGTVHEAVEGLHLATAGSAKRP